MAAGETRVAYDVVVVPADKRSVLLKQREDVFIQSLNDNDIWVKPSPSEDSILADYLRNNYTGAPKRFWNVRTGTRIGFNAEGVFIHEDHQKRYFGIDSKTASTALLNTIEQPVPMVDAKGEKCQSMSKGDRVLNKMLNHLPSLSDEMRYRVLQASFQRADRNKNGKISRPELGMILRRVAGSLSSSDVSAILSEADTDHDGSINYEEFVAWLKTSARPEVSKAFGKSLRNEADIVRTTFRLWDRNGDGLIPDNYLFKALKAAHPDMEETRVKALVRCMDSDHDGNIDYDEFVDFLFHRAG